MAALAIERDCLVLALSFWERLAAFRGPGTGLPGVVAYGVRLATGTAPDFAALHGRGPAVRVEMVAGAPFGRLLVTVEDPVATVAVIGAALGPSAAPEPFGDPRPRHDT